MCRAAWFFYGDHDSQILMETAPSAKLIENKGELNLIDSFVALLTSTYTDHSPVPDLTPYCTGTARAAAATAVARAVSASGLP